RGDGIAGFKRHRRDLSSDEIPIEDQPYAAAASPIALSLGYIADSNPEEDPEDQLEDGPAEYPADGGDDDDDSVVEIRLRAALPLPSLTSPPTHHPLSLPAPSTSRRADISEAVILPWERLCLTAPTSRFEVGESSTVAAVRQPGLGLLSLLTMDELVDAIQEGAPTTLEGVNARVTELVETHKQDKMHKTAELIYAESTYYSRIDSFTNRQLC
ncbi:hypothetical protein Tco_0691060, partial [Tanacetum coccineum]